MKLDHAKAAAARRAKIEAGAHFRRNWLEADNWLRLANENGYRLPQWHIPPTANKLKAVCRRFAVEYDALFGLAPRKLFQANPDVPLRVWVGIVLETAKNARS